MLLEPGERDTSAEALGRHLDDVAPPGNSVVIVAEIGDELAGYVELTGGSFQRNRATAHMVIGVVATASGRSGGAESPSRGQGCGYPVARGRPQVVPLQPPPGLPQLTEAVPVRTRPAAGCRPGWSLLPRCLPE